MREKPDLYHLVNDLLHESAMNGNLAVHRSPYGTWSIIVRDVPPEKMIEIEKRLGGKLDVRQDVAIAYEEGKQKEIPMTLVNLSIHADKHTIVEMSGSTYRPEVSLR
jgi:DNA-binding transcriptional regulator YdaS (Cro superfamily)